MDTAEQLAANHNAAAEIASKVTKQPAERFGWLFTKADYYRDPGMLPNLEALQKNIDMTTDLGFVKGKVDLARHVDLSIVKEAAARIKQAVRKDRWSHFDFTGHLTDMGPPLTK